MTAPTTDFIVAHECGATTLSAAMSVSKIEPGRDWLFTQSQLTAFADHIRQDEREANAVLCEDIEQQHWRDFKGRYIGPHPEPGKLGSTLVEGMSDGANECAVAIRSRKP